MRYEIVDREPWNHSVDSEAAYEQIPVLGFLGTVQRYLEAAFRPRKGAAAQAGSHRGSVGDPCSALRFATEAR